VTDGDPTRLVAWSRELRTVHDRLRRALEVTREAVANGDPADQTGTATRELLLFCHGFCAALTGHHRGEDGTLFPTLVGQHPELRETVAKLEHDHHLIELLIGDLQRVVERRGTPAELDRHLEGIAAIMESHFRFEERQLLGVLETLELAADPAVVLGPL
jgi:hemerythrin-like domain-containing protein